MRGDEYDSGRQHHCQDGNNLNCAIHVVHLSKQVYSQKASKGQPPPLHVELRKQALFWIRMPPRDLVSPTNPIETDGLKLEQPQITAGGIPAISSALRHAIGEAGVVRGTKLLRDLNQF